MGCQAVTPHLVSLAKRLEGRPFHLLASHCQNGSKDEVVAYIKSKGLAADTPNVTVSSQTRHPGIKGNGYVPYYVVFDHDGNMAYHHMCGDYHGGDGLEMIKWVDKLLEATPAIHLGDDPYEHITALAEKVRKRKGLAATVKKLEALQAGEDGPAKVEAARLIGVLATWRDRQLERVQGLMKKSPSKVTGALKDLTKELAGTKLGDPVRAHAKDLLGSELLKRNLALERAHAKVWKSIHKLRVPKEAQRRGIEEFDPGNPECRAAQPKALKKAVEKLQKALEGNEDLAFAETVRQSIKLLD